MKVPAIMAYTPTQRLSLWRRDLRVLWRHFRFGHARFSEAGRRARREALIHLFRSSNAHLASLGIDYWISFGTLLGWHRERQILAHDYDVDFGAPIAAFDRIWNSRNRLPPGLRLFDTSFRHPGPKLYFSYQGWEADVYFYTENHGQLRTLLNRAYPAETAPFPIEWQYPLRSVTLHEVATFVPAETEKWLLHTYGYIGPNAVQDKTTGHFHPRNPSAKIGA